MSAQAATTPVQAAGQGTRFSLLHGIRVADLCYLALRLSGWVVVTTCCVVAVYVAFFWMLGKFSLAGLILHFDNFGDRFLAADAARQARFEADLAGLSAALFALIGFFRRHSFPPLFADKKEISDVSK
ncbi:hypothetical protein ACFSAG_00020 [Sphingorhabdus buctiana]|uniref:Uncharacterized protein n=1 Tax=Sphingorhabdus buctiana TaxID=1508805 RepID=A0ABW4M855_9SPHN